MLKSASDTNARFALSTLSAEIIVKVVKLKRATKKAELLKSELMSVLTQANRHRWAISFPLTAITFCSNRSSQLFSLTILIPFNNSSISFDRRS